MDGHRVPQYWLHKLSNPGGLGEVFYSNESQFPPMLGDQSQLARNLKIVRLRPRKVLSKTSHS
jgi:hypothetical protein